MLEVSGSVSSAECCAAATGKGTNREGKVSGSFGKAVFDGRVWPVGAGPTFGPLTISGFGLFSPSLEGEIDGGVYAKLQVEVDGEVGLRRNECSDVAEDREGCVCARLGTTLTPSGSVKATGKAELSYNCLGCPGPVEASLDAELILGEFSWPLKISEISYNAKKCNDGLQGGIFDPGDLKFTSSLKFSGAFSPEPGEVYKVDNMITFKSCTIDENLAWMCD